MGKKQRPTPTPLVGTHGIIDAHTHVTSCSAPAVEVITRAWEAGLVGMVTVGDGLAEAQAALDVAQTYEGVYAACAIHPTKAHTLDEAAKRKLEVLAADPKCVAIGETGLDTYWIAQDPDNTASLEIQQDALAWHNELAIAVNKPLMIHNREADAELLGALDSLPQPPAVILHCFSSPKDVAQEAIARGYYLSFSGNATFKRNDYLREIAATMPPELLLIETDAPYMTPEPFRGARNEPAFIGHTAAVLAAQRGMALADFIQLTRRNFERVYGVDLTTASSDR
ncbi:MAG: TatD family hydrolase [Corynebacterium sp.]|nr:TatD family hydrolase [Corynebacterium sp.]